MSKQIGQTDALIDNLAVSSDITPDGPPSSSQIDQDLMPVFHLRLNMARGRAAKIRILRGQLAALETSYSAARAPLDRQLLAPEDRELLIYTADDLVRRHNPPALECGPEAEDKTRLRQAFFRYLLQEEEQIVIDFRIHCVNKGVEEICYAELADYLIGRHLERACSSLRPIEKSFSPATIRQLGLNSDQEAPHPDRKRHPSWFFSYPLAVGQYLNIYRRSELEAFYGQLLSAVSGLNRQRYEQYARQRDPLVRELDGLECQGNPLPSVAQLGTLGEQLRLHLLRLVFEQKIAKQTDQELKYNPQELLDLYGYFGRQEESRLLGEEFDSLPQQNLLMEGVSRLMRRQTRLKIIDTLAEGVPSPWLADMTAEMLTLVHALDRLATTRKLEEARQMSVQFSQELLLGLRRASAIKKPADPAIIESLFQEMNDLVQLARYCLKILSADQE